MSLPPDEPLSRTLARLVLDMYEQLRTFYPDIAAQQGARYHVHEDADHPGAWCLIEGVRYDDVYPDRPAAEEARRVAILHALSSHDAERRAAGDRE